MSDLTVRAENLSKRYQIGAQQELSHTLREAIVSAFSNPYQRLVSTIRGRRSSSARKTIWALDGVSFELRRGDAVGIIGRNGSGKSTLLKILSGITEPTEGYAELYGRPGALLEVGTGFHSELTGRENIFLNGAILGMRRREIQQKFDQIVDFSGIEQFIDTPVKYYSSGMYLRLAFSVASHLEPEILLVDEVLAVGDAEFQKKCLGKMGDVAREGRTVMFVSHNLAAVDRLCTRGIVLDRGKIIAEGQVQEAIQRYLKLVETANVESEESAGAVDITSLRVNASANNTVRSDQAFAARFTLRVGHPLISASIRLTMRDSEEHIVMYSSMDPADSSHLLEPGEYRIRVTVPVLWLKPALYGIQIKAIGEVLGKTKERAISDPLMISVTNPRLGDLTIPGTIAPPCEWEVE